MLCPPTVTVCLSNRVGSRRNASGSGMTDDALREVEHAVPMSTAEPARETSVARREMEDDIQQTPNRSMLAGTCKACVNLRQNTAMDGL